MSREKTQLFCPGTSDLNGTGKGLRNQVMCSDREIMANRLDILIKNKKEKTCLPIDVVVIPADRNVIQKDAENKLKYTSLCTERQ